MLWKRFWGNGAVVRGVTHPAPTGLCQRLALLAEEQLRPKPSRAPEVLRGEAGHPHGG